MGSPVTNILVVDDEKLFARAIKRKLERDHYQCSTATTLMEAREYLNSLREGNENLKPDLILLDMQLPDGNGLDFLAEIEDGIPVVIITAYGDIENAVTAMKNGASDYLKKPLDLKELGMVLERTLDSKEVRNRPTYPRQHYARATEGPILIGESTAIEKIRDTIDKITSLTDKGDEPPPTVLILGETGSGKDLTARLLHAKSGGVGRPFVQIDCAAMIENEMDIELFGNISPEKSGINPNRMGLIEAAGTGTLFFNEISELPLSFQSKLLQVIEHRITRALGTTQHNKVRARFIASSNRPLADMAKAGEFRADLFYRLNVLTLVLPPLRDRAIDIPLLSAYFLEKTARRFGKKESRLAPSALNAMKKYDWPGNVRELRYLLERAVLLCNENTIDSEDLGLSEHVSKNREDLVSITEATNDITLQAVEKTMIEGALLKTGGNVSRAARLLGITRMAMRYRMKKHGVSTNLRG